MDFSEEWKSLWAISSVFSPPLLLPPLKRRRIGGEQEEEDQTHENIGPIIFIPCPKTLMELYSSPSLAPRLPPPYPALSLTRFLRTSTSSLLYSDASSIASEFGPQISETHNFSYSYVHGFNSLQLLPCGDPNGESSSVLAFFPTGNNSDQVGFVNLCLRDSHLGVELNSGRKEVFVTNERLNYRIFKLLVSPVSDFDDSLPGVAATSSSSTCFAIIGYLMACTMHSVNWYVVKNVRQHNGLRRESEMVDFVGQRLFRHCAVINACWSPHLCEESVVLLETGELYLFDISSCLEKHYRSSNRVGGKKLKVLWGESTDLSHGYWLSVEFSWHPRILIVAHSSAVFLIDSRSQVCNVSCLLKIEMLSTVQNDGFIALCRAGCDGFNFCIASRRLLVLCDVRQAFRPLLKWLHSLDNPRYITVFRLHELRSNTKDDKFKWATESGYCILLGSFWNCEFSLFIYGPNNKWKSVSSEISNFCNSFYAWGLPSEFSLSAHDTHCGCCLIREEFSKDSLPDWVDWRQKKDVVLGFGILDRDPFAQLSNSDGFGGFSLVRLMSSGKLEAQRYQAVQEFDRTSDEVHKKTLFSSEDNLLYDMNVGEYDLKKKFQHLSLNYYLGYLKGNLAAILNEKIKQFHKVALEEKAKNESDKKLEAGESTGFRSLPRIFDVFKDINLPTSIHEIALRSIWAGMPTYLVRLAFSCRSEHTQVTEFESANTPDQIEMPQFPFKMPSSNSNKWSIQVQPFNDLIGCFVPPQILLTLHKLSVEKLTRNEKLGMEKIDILPADDELKFQCDKVMEAADELTWSHTEADSELHEGHAVSLADDTDEFINVNGNVKNFSFHEPVAFSDEVSTGDMTLENIGTGAKSFTIFLFRNQELCSNVPPEMVGLELLNTECPVQLKFNDRAICFGPNEVKTFKLLKQQDLDFRKGFGLYQKYVSKANLEK